MWQPKTPAKSDNLSFEDMMSRFKSQSEEKMADLDHETNNRRGGGYAPRSRRGLPQRGGPVFWWCGNAHGQERNQNACKI